MQRLVYTPRAYVFTKDANGNIRDLSRYVTAGDVSRKIGQVSTATVTLRNPQRIFTTPNESGVTALTPMDPITIYLKRLRGRPVRVFTGFLDKSTYWQMYPGTITLSASCTLKRLLYTFFDPALPYTQSFLAAYGWIPDPKNPGQWFSLNGLNDWKRTADEDAAEYEKLTGKRLPDDGSIAQLLYATMKHIGNWKDQDIFIETLPKDLFERLAELAKQFDADADATRKEFNELMRRIIGEGSYGDGDNNVDLSGIDGSVAEQVYKVGRELRAPHKHLLAAFMTGIVETNFKNLPGGDADSAGWRQERASLYPDPTNVPNSAKRFYTECKQLDHGQTAGELAADVQRPREDLRGRYAEERDKAATLLRKIENQVGKDDMDASAVPGQAMDPDRSKRSSTKGGKTKGDSNTKWGYPLAKKAQNLGGVAAHMSRKLGNWQSDNAVDMGAEPGTAWLAVEDGVISKDLGWGDSSGSGQSTVYGYRLHLVGDSGNVYFYQHGAANIAPQGRRVSKGDKIGEIGDYRSNGIPSHLHFAAENVSPEKVIEGSGIMFGDDATGDGGSGGEPDVMAAGAAAAFFGAINFPSMLESLEATSLGGEKSLMNDKPLLPFVQQLCEAGLREFQSLPDGKFFAFYPDYFGEMFHRKPYWEIDDIEVLDGKIELTDDALVTHMYVVGDTTMSGFTGSSDATRLNSMFSSGVVTIFNAFLADSMINRKPVKADDDKKAGPKPVGGKNDTRGMEFVMKKDEAISFLKRYGARPMVDPMPMIKHPYFEMFLAYQRFLLAWSKQFLSPFTFTFMPELYPGGKVGFPDHGLQMYIDEVTHSWSYESGFLTQANLSAPSMYGAKTEHLPPNMVKALVTAGDKG